MSKNLKSHMIVPIKIEISLNNMEDCKKALNKVKEIKEDHPDIVVVIRVQWINLLEVQCKVNPFHLPYSLYSHYI